MGLYIKDNIVALATPKGFGALAVVRVSGPALSLLFKKLTSIKKPLPRHAYFNKIKSSAGEIIDNVIITFFKAPHSFTGEDIIEISCHGGNVISSLLIDELILLGCRHAQPGEFSKRAYLNGKIDLTQAESIDLIIKASHSSQTKNGIMAFEGATKNAINKVKSLLYNLLLIIEHELDFTEDEISHTTQSQIKNKLKKSKNMLGDLIYSGIKATKAAGGIRTCIVGKPNAGKSTLFNTLLGYNRVVVSSEKGTTRDSIEAQIEISGILFTLIDTAGYWKGKDSLDKLGIEKTKEEIEKSDIIIVLDEKNPVSFSKKLNNIKEKPCLYVASKSDLGRIKSLTKNNISISSLKNKGLDVLLTSLSTLALDRFVPENAYITSNRQVVLLKKSLSSINEIYKNSESLDMAQLSSLLRFSIDEMDEIIGKTNNEDLLNKIFGSFCIGK